MSWFVWQEENDNGVAEVSIYTSRQQWIFIQTARFYDAMRCRLPEIEVEGFGEHVFSFRILYSWLFIEHSS
jgi:hypothetical protein